MSYMNGNAQTNGHNGHVLTNGTNGTTGTNGVNGTTAGRKRCIVDIIGAGTKCVWNKKVKGTQLEKFRQTINAKHNTNLENYWDLHKWSIDNYDKFWEEIWHYFGIICSKPYDEVVSKNPGFVDIEWFKGAKLNYTENLLRFRDDHTAIIYVDEEGGEDRVSYAEMYEEVKLYAAALRQNGLKKGDTVGCYMANRKEAVFAMLATASIGGVWGGPLPFYGAQAASRIIKPLSPKFLFTVDRFRDNKIEFNLLENLPFIVNDLDSIEKVIIVPSKEESLSKDISTVKNSIFLNDFLDTGRNRDGTVPELVFEQLSFNTPLFLNFTSGTTGNPKGLLHSTATILPLLRDFGLHCNFNRDDVIMTPFPVGWNLWNLFVANFMLGSTVLLYNGNPFFLSKTYLWDMMSQYRVSYTFLVTCIVDKLEKEGMVPEPGCNLEHLKMVTIGGSPVKLQNFDFLYRHVHEDLFVGCLYGATEVIGVFGGFDLNEPAYSGEIQAPALGVDLKCLDESGKHVVGKKGELVIGTPTPSMPIGVLNDEKHERLHELYLSKYPGMWCQNDEAWFDPVTNGLVVVGRSDETLNQNGERFGTADIYCAVHNMEELADYLCIGQDNSEGDQRAILFVKLKDGYKFSKELAKKVQDKVVTELTIDYMPAVVLEVKEIPYNLNNKKVERLVKKIIATNQIPEVTNVKNPGCLKNYCDIPELQGY